MPPLVSVLIPCFEHAAVLPWALASLVAQSHARWEAIVVDDGSADAPDRVVDAFADVRIRSIRLTTNRGPAAARQTALEHATGDLVALLDADDWCYPERLAVQVQALEDSTDVAAVGCGMAIIDADNRLRGVRGARAAEGACGAVRALPSSCGQATVMLRAEIARAARFDPSLRGAEDADYLATVLAGRRYRVVAGPLYAYRSPRRPQPESILRAHAHRRQRLRKLLDRHPVRAAGRILDSYAKSVGYAAAYRVRLGGLLERVRTRPPDPAEHRRFQEARARVGEYVAPASREGGS